MLKNQINGQQERIAANVGGARAGTEDNRASSFSDFRSQKLAETKNASEVHFSNVRSVLHFFSEVFGRNEVQMMVELSQKLRLFFALVNCEENLPVDQLHGVQIRGSPNRLSPLVFVAT